MKRQTTDAGQDAVFRAVSDPERIVEPYEEGLLGGGDEDLFSSQVYTERLMRLSAKDIAGSGVNLKVSLRADPGDETLAYTDLDSGVVVINVCNSITSSLPDRVLRAISIEGLRAHEAGHQLYTDAAAWRKYHESLAAGLFWPPLPEYLDATRARFGADILRVAAGKEPVGRTVVLETAQVIANILEDGWVDTRYSQDNRGRPADGIALNDICVQQQIPAADEMLREGTMPYTIVQNELLRYANGGEPRYQDAPKEIQDTCAKVLAIAEKCMLSPNAEDRCDGTNRILVEMWPMLRKGISALKAQTDKIPPPPGKKRKPAGAAEAAVREALQAQQPISRPNRGGRNGPLPESTGPADPAPRRKAVEDMIRRLQEAGHVPGASDAGGSPAAGTGVTPAAETAPQVPADSLPLQDSQGYLRQQQLQEQAVSLSYGEIHRGIKLQFHRRGAIPPACIVKYEQIATPLITLSRRLQKAVDRVIQDRSAGGRQKGLYSGKKLNQHGLGRRDGKVFQNNRALSEPVKLAVGLLVDESGSSATRSRLKRAGTAA